MKTKVPNQIGHSVENRYVITMKLSQLSYKPLSLGHAKFYRNRSIFLEMNPVNVDFYSLYTGNLLILEGTRSTLFLLRDISHLLSALG